MHPKTAIIGGGVIGSAIAYYLAKAGAQVTVIERDPTYARASSSLSGSAIRQQFSTPVNIRLSQFGIEYLRTAHLGLREPGYLYLATEPGAQTLRDNHRIQQECGADIALLSPAELATRFPDLQTQDLALASLGLSGEGWFDGPALMQHFRTQARALGATYRHATATALEMQGPRVSAIHLQDGTTIEADTIVNAAGPHARHIAAMAGATLPIEARKRCIFVFQCRTPLPNCPLVIDTTGVWFRPEGDRYLAGWSPPNDEEDLDLEVDHAQWDNIIWPALAARAPAFEQVRQTSAWAGHYDYNTFDQNAVLGPLPNAENLIYANGFSGHGMQQAPGVGRGIAELILHGHYKTLDLTPLNVTRIAENRPLLERCII